MKSKNFTKKLVLNKKTITLLQQDEMKGLKGAGTHTCVGVSLCDLPCKTYQPDCITQDPTWYPMHPCCY